MKTLVYLQLHISLYTGTVHVLSGVLEYIRQSDRRLGMLAGVHKFNNSNVRATAPWSFVKIHNFLSIFMIKINPFTKDYEYIPSRPQAELANREHYHIRSEIWLMREFAVAQVRTPPLPCLTWALQSWLAGSQAYYKYIPGPPQLSPLQSVRYARSECLYAALFATFFDVFMPP